MSRHYLIISKGKIYIFQVELDKLVDQPTKGCLDKLRIREVNSHCLFFEKYRNSKMRFCKFDLKKKFDDDLQKIATLLLSTESNEEAVVNYAQ